MNLPRGWLKTKLGEIVEPIETDDPTKRPTEQFRYVDIGSIDNRLLRIVDPKTMLGRDAPSRARRMIRAGDVLFSTVRPYLKNIATVPAELHGGLTSTGICVLRPSEGIESDFIFRRVASQDFIDAMTLASDGTMYPAIADRDVFEGAIALPPAAEQRRIVAKLGALTARLSRARGELDRVPIRVRQIERQVLTECFASTGRGETNLGDLLRGIEAGKNMRCEERPPHEGELGIVKVSAVTWGSFDSKQSKTLPPDYKPPEKARIRSGDLLISRANTLELVGAVVLVDKEPDGLFLSDKILRLVIDDDMKKWVLWYLRSSFGREQIERLATGNQLSMRNISQDALRRIRLPFPSAETRRRAIEQVESTFARAGRLEVEADRARALLGRLEAAILDKAFKGELVPQDASDEPASVLLDRIRVQRASESKSKHKPTGARHISA